MKLVEVNSIDEVIAQLEEYIEACMATQNRMGYFASLYCSVTQEVKKGIIEGRFEDAERMEALDVHFANFFFLATQTPSRVWQRAFNGATQEKYVLVQHLLLGMNAHINYDLALAVQKSVDASQMQNLLNDYEEINTILLEQIDRMQEAINKSWWVYRLLDYVALRFDEAAVGFSLIKARKSAWSFALQLQDNHNDDQVIEAMETLTLTFADSVEHPKGIFKLLQWLNHLFEPKSVSRLISIIRQR